MEPARKKICVLGSANVDYFVYVKHIPVPGETIQSDRFMCANGGKGANQAVAASMLSGSCSFIGQVGEDDQMRSLKEEMEQAGVQLVWKLKKDVGTGKAFIYVDETSGENSIVIVGGANMDYDNLTQLDKSFTDAIDQCDYLLLQKQIPMSIDLLAAKYASSKGKIVILDCGGRDDDIPQEMLDYLSYISPNETELLRLDPSINSDNILEQIRNKLLNKHPNLKVLLKLGSKGSAIITQSVYEVCPVVTKINPEVLDEYKIIDAVGAGDCFTAAYAVMHSQLDWSNQETRAANYRRAMLFGNSAAFICITRSGAMPAMPLRKQVDQLINKYNIQ